MPRTAMHHITGRLTSMMTVVLVVLIVFVPMLSKANVIRDTELEAGLLGIARPMAAEAGLDPETLQIRIVIASEYNAFVTGDGFIYIHSGLIMQAENMLEIAGVMAHEIGHIAAGHVVQRHGVIADAGMATLLGAVAAVALTAAGSADAAVGVMAGSADQTRRIVLARSRQDEGVADEYAIRLMQNEGYSVAPLAERMRQIATQRMLPESRQSEYYMTHPGALERSAVFQDHINTHESGSFEEPLWMTTLHNRLKSKLEGWSTPPRNVLKSSMRAEGSDADYMRAIAFHRLSDVTAAREVMQELVAAHPDDAFYHEFLGDVLLASGDAAAAAVSYERALELLAETTNTGQIELSLGRAYLALNDPQSIEKAIIALEKAHRHEPEWAFVKHQLGIGLGRAGRFAEADLILAEEALMNNNTDLARQLAERVTSNAEATPEQLQLAHDILREVKP